MKKDRHSVVIGPSRDREMSFCLFGFAWGLEHLANFLQFFLLVGIDPGKCEVHAFQRIDNSSSDDYPCKPFVIGWNNIPGSMFRTSVPDHVFISFHVVVPVLS